MSQSDRPIQYRGSDGVECSLEILCRREPGWAAARIRIMLDALDRIRKSIRPCYPPVAMAEWERVAADPEGLAGLVDAAVNGVPDSAPLAPLRPATACIVDVGGPSLHSCFVGSNVYRNLRGSGVQGESWTLTPPVPMVGARSVSAVPIGIVVQVEPRTLIWFAEEP